GRAILVMNAGSSSVKFSLYTVGGNGELVAGEDGQLEGIGTRPHLRVVDASGKVIVDRPAAAPDRAGHRGAIDEIRAFLGERLAPTDLLAVGHRVVHGGTEFAEPVRVDGRVLAQLNALVPLAPLHQPHNLAAIHAVSEALPVLPQVACFDT